MLKIRLQRKGRRNRPFYRIVVAEHSAPVQGKFVDILGHYNPLDKETVFKKDLVLQYLQNGAQPSQTVARLGVKNGIEEFKPFIQERVMKPKKVEETNS